MNKPSTTHTIAFYNIENLFDIENDPLTNDDDFLPTSAKRWTPKRYQNKLRKLGSVISRIGRDDTEVAPVIVGLAEVENKKVLSDLVQSKHLIDENYSYVHFDSSDERGIDVALLYKKRLFRIRKFRNVLRISSNRYWRKRLYPRYSLSTRQIKWRHTQYHR